MAMKIPLTELHLGDTVKVFDGNWSTAIVKQIKDGQVTFFRPYGTTADFSYTGGVICYTGIEEYKLPLNWHSQVELLERQELK